MSDELKTGDSSAPNAGVIPDMGMFLASSVHDMKNSISILIDGLERVLGQMAPDSFPAYRDMVSMTYEARRINSNLIQLLTVYKVGEHLYPFDPVPQSIDEFAMGIFFQQEPLLKSQGVTLELDYDKSLYWQFDGDLVAGVISHALNNAIRYSKGRVKLVVAEVNGMLEMRLEDDGGGYPDAMVEQGVAAMRGTDFHGGSTGLGLFFSALVAKMHVRKDRTGEIKLENGGCYDGASFILRLP